MPGLIAERPHRRITRFQITPFQYLLFAIASISILALGFSAIAQSNSAITEAKVLSDVETPAASIIFTQRESLVYATRLAQWSNGGTSRRNVQIARNILAQRLAVIDTSGKSMGERAQPSYWRALRKSDLIVAQSVPGILPESDHDKVNLEISPIINEILAQSRNLVVSYQRSVDRELELDARRAAGHDRRNLIFFFIFLATGSLFLLLNARTNFKNYRIAREMIESEQRQLDQTLEELKRAEDTVLELQDINEAKNAFISTINHELRTPLTSIIGYIELLRESASINPDRDGAKYLDALDRNAQLLLHIVESILAISKLDANTSTQVFQSLEINQIIENAIFLLQPVIPTSAERVVFSYGKKISLDGDAGQLSQVFINILGNALKFSPPESRVEIDLREGVINSRACAIIDITDHGIGIPEGDIEKITSRFFRAKNADSGQYPGTGLGLAIVKEILERHGGEFSIASLLNEGTTVTIYIPLPATSEEQIILDRRGDVLTRAISSLEKSTPSDIKAVTHDIGGAIGFYTFEREGQELLSFSRTIGDNAVELQEFLVEKNRLLDILRTAQHKLGGEDNG